MALRIRDTRSGRVGPVEPPGGGRVRIYVCGPDVYAPAHVGHARTFLYFDVVRRYLEEEGRPTRHVMNITDFADKITNRATELGLSWEELARTEALRFLEDLDGLRIRRPHVIPRASHFVRPMIEVIRHLERKGHVRREGDEWYYLPSERPDPRNFPIGEELQAHAVLECNGSAPVRAPFERDFMVWKRQERPAPSWPSPWGPGMPGWHLECYAMAERYLGLPVDLHGGGIDLIYPHHYAENEVALTLRNRLFSRRFLHTAFVTLNRTKMSKSTGELIPLRAALGKFGPDALRLYLLSRPYNQRLEWNDTEAARAAGLMGEVQETLRASVPRGAEGAVPMARLTGLVRDVRRDIGTQLGVDRALQRVTDWAGWLAHQARPRIRTAARRDVVGAYRTIERLTGLNLLGAPARPRPTRPRARSTG